MQTFTHHKQLKSSKIAKTVCCLKVPNRAIGAKSDLLCDRFLNFWYSIKSRRSGCDRELNAHRFIVLPHWSFIPWTLDMTPHSVTWSWYWVDQFSLYPVTLSAKRGTASTIFNDFGMVARDRTRDNPFPGADTLPTEQPGPVIRSWRQTTELIILQKDIHYVAKFLRQIVPEN